MRRRMAWTKKKVDPFEFQCSDDESDDEDKLSAKRKSHNSGNSTPHSVNGLDDGVGSTCRDEDGGLSTCRAKLCFPGSGNQSNTVASATGSSEEGDEGDDEESGRGSSDNDDKIHCSICAGEILWPSFSQTVALPLPAPNVANTGAGKLLSVQSVAARPCYCSIKQWYLLNQHTHTHTHTQTHTLHARTLTCVN